MNDSGILKRVDKKAKVSPRGVTAGEVSLGDFTGNDGSIIIIKL